MAYHNFKLIDLQKEFGLKIEQKNFLDAKQIRSSIPFGWTEEQAIHIDVAELYSKTAPLRYIAWAILWEAETNTPKNIVLWHDESLNADRLRKLNGRIDYMFLQRSDSLMKFAPLLCVTITKANKKLEQHIARVAAQMMGAQVFNQKYQQQLPIIYGAITSGRTWLFLQLSQNTLTIDTNIYTYDDLPFLLGIFQHLLKPQPFS